MITFDKVLEYFPYEKIWELLNNPRPIDDTTFYYLKRWCSNASRINVKTFMEVTQKISFHPYDQTIPPPTKSEVYRLIKSKALKWNGIKVTDAYMEISWLKPGWGVLQIGKKTHVVVLS